MKKKLIPALAIVLLLGGYEGYSMATAPPPPKLKIPGQIYILPKDFTLNMSGGQYATLTVALQLPADEAMATTSPTDPPPTGFGDLPDEAVVRAIITNDVTDQPTSALVTTSAARSSRPRSCRTSTSRPTSRRAPSTSPTSPSSRRAI